MQIHLVRHGRSAHTGRGWVNRAGLDAWVADYDAAGLIAGEKPPASVCELASRSGIVVCSDLARAIESAALLVPGRDVPRNPVLREATMPTPSLGRVSLPMRAWDLLMSASWFWQLSQETHDTPTEVRQRGREGADWLCELAGAHESVLAVTHGAFRRYLADALEARGWVRRPARREYHNWSVWSFEP